MQDQGGKNRKKQKRCEDEDEMDGQTVRQRKKKKHVDQVENVEDGGNRKKFLKKCIKNCSAKYSKKRRREKGEIEKDTAADDISVEGLFEDETDKKNSQPEELVKKESEKDASNFEKETVDKSNEAESEKPAEEKKTEKVLTEKEVNSANGSSQDKLNHNVHQDKINLFSVNSEAEKTQINFYEKFTHLLDSLTHYVSKCIECPRQLSIIPHKTDDGHAVVHSKATKIHPLSSAESQVVIPAIEQSSADRGHASFSEDFSHPSTNSSLRFRESFGSKLKSGSSAFSSSGISRDKYAPMILPSAQQDSSVTVWTPTNQSFKSSTESINLFPQKSTQVAIRSSFHRLDSVELKEKINRMKLHDLYSLDSYFDNSELAALINIDTSNQDCAKLAFQIVKGVEDNAYAIMQDILTSQDLTIRDFIEYLSLKVDTFKLSCNLKQFIASYSEHMNVKNGNCNTRLEKFSSNSLAMCEFRQT